ncbi:hypothetical protein [Thermus sp. CCB_US3_UF1]|uniref:hypothetical protein n=1 Tax=Thermus sp. CCB_US3_UF1 TaxID=1111069 RepID=UPI00059E55E0|nr:hypothetical protein [Thermus sp. CCB_US3_UF1]
MGAERWIAKVVEALGRSPRTPEEALATLGVLLRANPTEKEEFLRDAHAAWVGGGWAIRGDNSPEARVVLMALEEATRRLARQRNWQGKQERQEVRLSLAPEVAERVVVVSTSPKGVKEGVFRVGGTGLSQKALWAAAYRVAKGEKVYLVGSLASKARKMVLARVAKILTKEAQKNTVKLPWGQARLLPGDRWEDLEAPEPRIAVAIRELRRWYEEEKREEEEEEREGWAHQTRVDPWVVKALISSVDPDAEEVDLAYFRDLQGDALSILDEWILEVDVYNPSELYWALGVSKGSRFKREGGWWGVVATVLRFSKPFTFAEVKEVWQEKRKGWGWEFKVIRLLQPIVAWEVALMGFKDPEYAYSWGLTEGVKIAKRLKAGKLNPLVFLVPEIRKRLAELRAQEVGVFKLSHREAKAIRRYFGLLKEKTPEEAAKEAGLPKELREALEAAGHLSTDLMREVGVEPAEEMDYDALLLRAKVKSVLEEVKLLFGDTGVAFVEALMEGASVEGVVSRVMCKSLCTGGIPLLKHLLQHLLHLREPL